MKKIYSTLILAFVAFNLHAATITSTTSGGAWTSGGTWVGGVAPGAADHVVIQETATVTLSALTTCAGIEMSGTVSGQGLVVNGDLVVNTLGTFNPNGNACAINGNLINNGKVNFSLPGTAIRLGTPTPAVATSISGSGEFLTGVIRVLRSDNSAGLTLSVPVSISGELGLWRGAFTSNGNITLDNTNLGGGIATPLTTVKFVRQQTASLDVAFTVGATAVLTLEYSKYTSLPNAAISSGVEVPISGLAYALVINNPGGVTINNDLTLSSATPLTLTNGIVNLDPANTIICSNVAYSGTAGTAAAHINGGLALTAGVTPSTKTYPLGSLSQSRPVVITDLSAASATVTLRFAILGSNGGTSASNLNLSDTRRWAGSVLSGSLSGYTSLGINYGNDDFTGAPSTAPTAIAKATTIGGTYVTMGVGNNTGAAIVSPISSYSALGYFALANGEGTLPISLLSFDAKYKNNKVQLNWKTASEINSKSFEIEKSVNGTDFVKITSLPGSNTSNELHTYEAFDYNPLGGLSYYRLKQIDIDGKVNLFGIKSVNIQELTNNKLTIYKDSRTNVLDITIPNSTLAQVNISIIDMNGRILYKELMNSSSENGLFQTTIQKQFVKGVYIISITGNGFSKAEKVYFEN